MLDYDFLLDYELKERNIIERSKLKASNTQFVTCANDIYPDVDIGAGTVYLRGNVPLKLLLLLYDKIIIFMPPANQEYFEKNTNYRLMIF